LNTQHTGSVPGSPRYALIRPFLLVAIVLMSFIETYGKCYYIRPSGNDANTGLSTNAAWKTIAKLNTVNLLPGDSVLFEGGQTFLGTIYLNSSDGNSSAQPVVISSYGPPTATIDAGSSRGISVYNSGGFNISRLVLRGAGMNVNNEDGLLLYTDLTGSARPSNIKIENIEIYGFGKTGLTFGSWNGNAGFDNLLIDHVKVHDVLMNGITSYGFTSPTHIGWSHKNVVISNCEVRNVPGYADANNHKGSGIMLGQVDGAKIENCVAHHNGTANIACGGPGGIWAYDSNNLLIQYCESYSNSAGTGCDGLGFDLDGGVTNSVIQYCYSHDNDGAGFLLGQYANARIWKNNIVRFNISVNDGRTNSGGITLFKGPGTIMHSVDIYHNTVYISKSGSDNAGAFTIIDWNTGIDSVRAMNNIFQSAGGEALVRIAPGYSAVMTGNLYSSGTGNFEIYDQNNLYTSLSAWRTATGREILNNANTGITGDPLLSNAGTAPVIWPATPKSLTAYKPAANSPVINAAITLTTLGITTGNTDFYTSIFPSGPKADIGAGEYFFAPITPTAPPATTLAPSTATAVVSASVAPGTTSTSPVTTSIRAAQDDDDFILFPNPVSRGEVLHLSGLTAEMLVELYTLSGSKVAEFRGTSEIATESLSVGLYLIVIHPSEGNPFSRKFIVR
jgi:hypothetical protein